MRPFRWTALFSALLALLVARNSQATVIDTVNFTETPWITLSGSLTGMAWAPDGSKRLFVIDKGGVVQIVKWGTPPTVVTFTTIAPVFTDSECGLIGITFDPNFQVNHYVYFFVTVSASEQQIIRYTANGDVGAEKTVIVPGLPTVGANHDGGAIAFGLDGKLYWGIGDLGNGTGVNADLSSLAAKIGRANADGSAPDDNPFFDGSGPNNDYIWARGFRNPFTMTFQSATGLPWVNVVGTAYEQVFVVRRGDHAGYNAYENNQPSGFITPVIKYRTNGVDAIPLASASRTANVVTFSTTAPHGFRIGERIDVTGVSNATFNGPFYVAAVPAASTFTAAQNGSNASGTGGTATTLNQGGCITGGTFYDATQFGAAYRGNFFYGDYNSARIMRAVLGAGDTVASVDYWATNITSITDTSVGPDGALYYMGIGGAVYRTTFNNSAQAIVVSGTHLWMMEGGQTSFDVSLAVVPGANVTVNVTRMAGDADVNVGTAVLTFTPTNWNVPQAVTVTAADDLDTALDTATFTASSSGLAGQDVTVNVTDDDANNFVVSRAALSVNEGSSDTFTVALVKAPAAALTATVARASGDTDVTVTGGAMLTFNASNFGAPQTVTISAAEDADSANDLATVSITASGIAPRTVAVTAVDNEVAAPVITSTPSTRAVVNAPYRYMVVATGLPAPTFSLTSAPPGMTIDSAGGIITWTPAAQGSFPVTVAATNGVLPDAAQSFALLVGPDAVPTCALTKPTQGEVVSGKNSEFFGDGFDDVGTTKADFFVDGVLRNTDANTLGHYHFGGAHNLWDTTVLSDGAHKAKMVVSDTIGQQCEKEVDVVVANLGDGGTPDGGAADGGTADAGARDGAVDDSGGRDGALDAVTDASRDGDRDTSGSEDAAARTDATRPDAGDSGKGDADAGGAPSDGDPADCGCRIVDGRRRPRARAAWLAVAAAFVLRARRRKSS